MALLWLVLLLGVVAIFACMFMPREIGKEDQPLSSVRVDLPDLERLVLRMRQHQARPRPMRMARPPAPEPPPAPEAPSAMGAPQPVLTQEPGAPFVLPGQ